jgi:hypothetical protein
LRAVFEDKKASLDTGLTDISDSQK